MDSNLKQLLYTHTETEEWHRTHPGELSPRYNRVETTTINGEEVYLFDWKETLDENPVGLIKESRFTDIPPHMNRATYCTLRSVLLRRYAASVSCWLSLICENVLPVFCLIKLLR